MAKRYGGLCPSKSEVNLFRGCDRLYSGLSDSASGSKIGAILSRQRRRIRVVQLVRTLPRRWLESYTVTANSLSPARQQFQKAAPQTV